MKHYFNPGFLILLFCLLFYSCEWDNSDENYVELEKPQDIVLGIDLAGVKEDQVVYIYNNTNLYYSLSTQGKEVLEMTFYLDGKEVRADYEKIYLSVDNVDDKEHDLKLKIRLRSGSGTVADFANLEYYLGEHNFKLKFINRTTTEYNLEIKQTLDENNNLKLTWDIPELSVDKYEIYDVAWWGSDKKLIATIDPGQNWFVDKNYVYGFQQYRVLAYVSNSVDVYYEGIHTVEYTAINQDNFKVEIEGLEKSRLTFTNPNPYPFTLVVKDGYGNTYKMKDGDNIPLVKSLFPSSGESVNTYLLPANYEGSDYSNFKDTYFYYSDNKLEGLPAVTSIDMVRLQVIGSNFSNFYVYDKDLKKASSSVIHYNLHSRSQVNSFVNGMVAIQDINNYIHVYSDNIINNELWNIPLKSSEKFTTGKNLLTVTDPTLSTLSVYDVTTKMKLFTENYGDGSTYYSRWLYAYLSHDDKYLAVLGRNYSESIGWYKIYEISGNTLVEKKTEENVPINNIAFNYNNPDEVFICLNGKFEVIDLPTMQKKKTILGFFRDVDRITGNLIYLVSPQVGASTHLYKILSPDYATEILSFSTSKDYDERLFNNYFMSSVYFIHIDKIKNQ